MHSIGVNFLIYPVHPHVCGEHLVVPVCVVVPSGSSPRLWGTLTISVRVPLLRRFIPTSVGNIVDYDAIRDVFTVHPHVCGEHNVSNNKLDKHHGSSPRLWGTLYLNGKLEEVNRFIPTSVGNITLPTGVLSGFTVHPHVCGEHYSFSFPSSG